MRTTVYLSEQGNDKADGETETSAVRTAAQAIKIANRIRASEIRVLGDSAMRNQLTAALEAERKKRHIQKIRKLRRHADRIF